MYNMHSDFPDNFMVKKCILYSKFYGTDQSVTTNLVLKMMTHLVYKEFGSIVE